MSQIFAIYILNLNDVIIFKTWFKTIFKMFSEFDGFISLYIYALF